MAPITALLLGAGFSCQMGMPLAWELTAELRRWLTPAKFRELNELWKTRGLGHREDNLLLLCDLLSRSDLNYEHLIGAIEVEIWRVASDIARYQDLHGIREWLLEIVYHLFYYRQVLNVGYVKTRFPLYSGLQALCERS